MSIKGILSKIKIERPLANAHWSLLVFLITLIVLSRGPSCSKTGDLIGFYFMPIIFVLIVLWVRHLKFHPINSSKILLKYTTTVLLDIFISIVMVVVITIPLMVIIPHYDCYTVRHKVSEGLLALSMQRTTIAEAYGNTGSMPDNYEINEKGNISRYAASTQWIKYDQNSGILITTLSSDKGLEEAADNTVLLKAKGNPATRSVEFTCSKGSVPIKYLPSFCREK